MAAGLYAFHSLRGPQGVSALIEKRREIHQLQQENAELENRNRAKRERIRNLRESQAELDLEIRRSQKLLKRKEQTFIIEQGPADTPAR